jgi:POT family proton-dependent oligopeptide transporter
LLGAAGTSRGNEKPVPLAERLLAGGAAAVAATVIALGLAGVIHFQPVILARGMAYVILAIAVVFFASAFLFGRLSPAEKKQVAMVLVLFLTSAVFWAGFEQAGSSFNLMGARFTQRHLDWLNFDVPAAWFQSLGAVFIIAFAPAFAFLWGWLARRQLNPSIPVKFGLGLLLLAAGFLVMAGAARVVAAGHLAAPTWLLTTYLLHTFGELCLSPVGLSSVTKLAPRKLAGQMMGVWFLATSLGNQLAGLLAGEFNAGALEQWPGLYLKIALLPALAGLLLILLAKPLRKLMHGIH